MFGNGLSQLGAPSVDGQIAVVGNRRSLSPPPLALENRLFQLFLEPGQPFIHGLAASSILCDCPCCSTKPVPVHLPG